MTARLDAGLTPETLRRLRDRAIRRATGGYRVAEINCSHLEQLLDVAELALGLAAKRERVEEVRP